ncbi:putative peptidase S8 [Paenibacillus sp. 598K]|nr:putative peptidase S8 [Paenibacillus sp. 598K]
MALLLLLQPLAALLPLPKAVAQEASTRFEPVSTADVRLYEGSPTLHINGKPQPFIAWAQWEHYPRFTQSAQESGIHIYQPRHTTAFPTIEVWLPSMETVAKQDEKAYFLPVLWLGSDTTFGFDRNNADEVNADAASSWGAVSFGSQEWLNRAELFLREQIRQYEASRVGNRIIGYQLTAGTTGEWFYPDTWANRDFDRSAANTATFRSWLAAAYEQDAEKLQQAWNSPEVSFDTAEIPAKQGGEHFLDAQNSRAVMDYVQYANEQVAVVTDKLAAIVKEETADKKVVSIYSGYTMAFGQYSPLSGQLALEQMLQSDNLDIFFSPFDYVHRNLNGYSTAHGAMDSIRRAGKLYVAEDDYATHIGSDHWGAEALAKDVEGTLALMWRNFGYTLTKSFGQWWYDDTGYGNFNNARMMNAIGQMNALAETNLELHARSSASDPAKAGAGSSLAKAEIALVVDEFSQMVQSVSSSYLNEELRLLRNELSKAGAPYDVILLSDLLSGQDDPYKLYIMANTYALDQTDKRALQQWNASGKTVLWLYAPGYWSRDDDGIDRTGVDAMREITGLPISEQPAGTYSILAENTAQPLMEGIAEGEVLGAAAKPLPVFTIAETTGLEVLGRMNGEAAAVLRADGDTQTIWVGAPRLLSPVFYRNVAKLAGVHVYSDYNRQVEANSDFSFITIPEASTEMIRFKDGLPKYNVLRDELVQPSPDGLLEVTTTGPETLVFFSGDKEKLPLPAAAVSDPVLARLAVLTASDSLKAAGEREARIRELSTGSRLPLTVMGITPEGYYFAEDEMREPAQWSSSDEAVAEVDGQGTIFAKSAGQAQITANVGGVAGTLTIVVKAPLEVGMMSDLQKPDTVWSTWSAVNGYNPFELGVGNAYGTASLQEQAIGQDGAVREVYRLEPLMEGEQVGVAIHTVDVPARAGVKVVADFQYPQGTSPGTPNTLFVMGYRGTTNLFVHQSDLAATSAGATAEVNLDTYAGQQIRLDFIIRDKADPGVAAVDLTGLRLAYEDREADKLFARLSFSESNTLIPASQSAVLTVNKHFTDGSSERWMPEPGARWEVDRPDIVRVAEDGTATGLKPGRAAITLITADAITRTYVKVAAPDEDDYNYENVLPMFAQGGTWWSEPYDPFVFGSVHEAGGAYIAESMALEDGQTYRDVLMIEGGASSEAINGRATLHIPDAEEVYLVGKLGFTNEAPDEQQSASFYIRSWDSRNPFYNEYQLSNDGSLTEVSINVSSFRGQSIELNDLYLSHKGTPSKVAVADLAFRYTAKALPEQVALVASQPYARLAPGEEWTAQVKVLMDNGNLSEASETVRWTTDQASVVEVANNGTIRALKPGIAIVRAESSWLRTELLVEVRASGEAPPYVWQDPYRWTMLERLDFGLSDADRAYRYTGLRILSPKPSEGGDPSTPSVPPVTPLPSTPPPQPTSQAIGNGDGSISVRPLLKDGSDTAIAEVPANALADARKYAATSDRGRRVMTLDVAFVEGASGYEIHLPAKVVADLGKGFDLHVKTRLAVILIPIERLVAAGIGTGEQLTIKLSAAAASGKTGAKPELLLDVQLDSQALNWDSWQMDGANEKGNPWTTFIHPMVVRVPYTPTLTERRNTEFLTVRQADSHGARQSIASGRYHSESGEMVFEAQAPGRYQIAYAPTSFSDMSKYAWASPAIHALAAKGIINGTSTALFSPAAPVTRAEYVTLLIRALGIPGMPGTSFRDVESNAYYYETVGAAARLGVVTGTGAGEFKPGAPISRQEMMVMAARALTGLEQLETSTGLDALAPFTDRDQIADYAIESLASLVDAGLIEGKGETLAPRALATRAEAAMFLYRLYSARYE